ncbi:MAG TPA: hypothetical protein VLI04_03050, partial [Nocardioidaceae bacterium]|nr:hypothetical protein [Nocardioidaceae bacterium]
NTACYAEGPDTHFEMRVNGQYAGSGECTPGEPPTRLNAVGFSSVPGPGSPWKGITSNGGPFNLEVYTTQGDRGPRVTDDTARLMAGVYRLPEPLDVVQGNAVYEQEYFEGRTWEFESIGESPENVRRWESSAGGVPDEDRIAMVTVEGTGVATVSANGQERVAMSSGVGTTLEVPLADGRRSVLVEISKGMAVRVVVVWYRPAD